jgi:hypothetical protein
LGVEQSTLKLRLTTTCHTVCDKEVQVEANDKHVLSDSLKIECTAVDVGRGNGGQCCSEFADVGNPRIWMGSETCIPAQDEDIDNLIGQCHNKGSVP